MRRCALPVVALLLLTTGCSDDDTQPVADAAQDQAPLPDLARVDLPPEGPPTHCVGVPTDMSKLCLEPATGRAGDTVEIRVYLLGKQGCTEFGQSAGHIKFRDDRLSLENPLDGCFNREVRLEPDHHVYWKARTGSVGQTQCAASFAPGLLDRIQFKISANAEPADYLLVWRDNLLESAQPGCAGTMGVNGWVRVVN